MNSEKCIIYIKEQSFDLNEVNNFFFSKLFYNKFRMRMKIKNLFAFKMMDKLNPLMNYMD